MSKKQKATGVEQGPVGIDGTPMWGYAYVSDDNVPNIINGRLFELIEAVGLPQKQEESIKSLIRKTIWECFEESVYIKPDRHNEIRKAFYEMRKSSQANGLPNNAI